MMFSTVGIALIAAIFMMLVPIALLVVLQVWLCRKSQGLGLILPVLSLLVSLVLVFSMTAFQTVTRGGAYMVDEKGQIIEEYQPEPVHSELLPGAVGAIAGLFLVSNIPTVVYGGIWLHYKNRRDFQDDLRKMRIEDLE